MRGSFMSVRAKIKTKMTNFKVPQNVQREDTIIGPVTMRQLIICGIGGTITYIFYVALAKTYYFEVWILPVAISAILTVTFAFVKIHGMTFLRFLLYLAEYLFLPKKRVFVKGAGDFFVSDMMEIAKKPQAQDEKTAKPKKSIDELVKILDSKRLAKKPD